MRGWQRSGGNWLQVAKLLPTDGASGDKFGLSVAISGDTIIVGSMGNNANYLDSGAAYIFKLVGGQWLQSAKLLASDAAPFDFLGASVSISGDTAIVGAPYKNYQGISYVGAAYIFENQGGPWVQVQKLLPANNFAQNNFGFGVAINGSTVVVSSHNDDDNGVNAGAAYIYALEGGTWVQQVKLIASDGAAEDIFGASPSLSGNFLIVSAVGADDSGPNSGAVYVFCKHGSTWTEAAKLLATDGVANNYYGFRVSLSGNTAIVGTYLGPTVSGSIYICAIGQTCEIDMNCDGVVNVDDLLLLLAAWGDCPPKGDCPADLAPAGPQVGDGVVNVDDLLVLLANWG